MNNTIKAVELENEPASDVKNVPVRLQLLLFSEDDISYAYIPALDILGYGYNEKESFDSVKTLLSEFFKYTIDTDTFATEIKRLGWQKLKKSYQIPDTTELTKTNEQLRDIINHKQYRADIYEVSIPFFA